MRGTITNVRNGDVCVKFTDPGFCKEVWLPEMCCQITDSIRVGDEIVVLVLHEVASGRRGR
jgi:hypothetical protein